MQHAAHADSHVRTAGTLAALPFAPPALLTSAPVFQLRGLHGEGKIQKHWKQG